MKNVSDSPNPEHQLPAARARNKQFIVIEIPAKDGEHDYPKAVFACDTVEEATLLCTRMNSDAGYERYGIQRPANGSKKDL